MWGESDEPNKNHSLFFSHFNLRELSSPDRRKWLILSKKNFLFFSYMGQNNRKWLTSSISSLHNQQIRSFLLSPHLLPLSILRKFDPTSAWPGCPFVRLAGYPNNFCNQNCPQISYRSEVFYCQHIGVSKRKRTCPLEFY